MSDESTGNEEPTGTGEAALSDDGALAAEWRAWEDERRRRYQQLQHDARAVYRAVEGWHRVDSPEDWERTCQEAREGYRSGRFLIERLGAERYLDPELMAVLWGLRQGLRAEGTGTAAEAMLVDLTVIAYHRALRLQGWAGNLEGLVEAEFFGEAGPSARFAGRYGRASGLVVEERLERLGEQLLPLQERANRLVVRNLKALSELRRGPAPKVAIERAEHVNIAQQQLHVNAVVEEQASTEPRPDATSGLAGGPAAARTGPRRTKRVRATRPAAEG